MRPRSIIGPLLLILIGVLFLLNNIMPDLRFLDLAARYWPFLLIGWGVLRLIEVLIWYFTSKPVAGAGIGGGEWTLIVFLCLLGSGLFLAHRFQTRHGPWAFRGVEVFGESYDFPIAETKTPAPSTSGRIVIENLRGNARVTGADTAEIKVNGRKSIRAMNQGEADQGDKSTPVEVVRQGETIVIRTNQERISGGRRISSDLEITVPRGTSVEARGRYGDFDIADLAGSVEINSDNAGVRLQSIGGNVRVETRRSDIVRAGNVKGSVELRGRGQDLNLEDIAGQVTISAAYVGDVQFRKLAKPLRWSAENKTGTTQLEVAQLPGEIRMDLRSFTGNNLVGPVRLIARSLDAQIGDFTQSLEVEFERGDIELRPSKAPIGAMNVRTASGNIEFAPPPAAKFEITATANHGEVENDYGAPLTLSRSGEENGKGRGRRSAVLSGSVGAGPAVKLTSDRGRITIRKGSGEQVSVQMAPPKPQPPPKPQEPLKVEKN